MDFLVISGLSGAGKSRAAAMLEDMDFYCVDNMPVALMPRFAELCIATRARYERVALVTDVREKGGFDELFKALDAMAEMGCEYKILFVEADTGTIVKRYKETRRRHPLDPEGANIGAAVERERSILEPVRRRADYIIDSSNLTLSNLQRELYAMFMSGSEGALTVNIVSFGYKNGVPLDADLLFDVRFLPNPFYVPELKFLGGTDRPVADYIMGFEETAGFMSKLTDMLDYLLPLYVEEGKHFLVIGIGCTGGRHRSVAVAEELGKTLAGKDWHVQVSHRDMDKFQ